MSERGGSAANRRALRVITGAAHVDTDNKPVSGQGGFCDSAYGKASPARERKLYEKKMKNFEK